MCVEVRTCYSPHQFYSPEYILGEKYQQPGESITAPESKIEKYVVWKKLNRSRLDHFPILPYQTIRKVYHELTIKPYSTPLVENCPNHHLPHRDHSSLDHHHSQHHHPVPTPPCWGQGNGERFSLRLSLPRVHFY